MGILVASCFLSMAALGGWFWTAMVTFSIYASFTELKVIMQGVGIKPSQIIVITAAVFMVLMAALDKPHFLSPILTLVVIASFFRLVFRSPRATIADIGGTLICVFYAVYLQVHYILLRQLGPVTHVTPWLQSGFLYLAFTLVVISASDTAAYYVGKRYGKNLLSPEISPKKTREGAMGGMVAGVLIGVLLAYSTQMFSLPHAVILSVLLVVVGQLGDLAESLMKRDSGLKDSGALLASHGGFLDRADSYIFSGAVSYYYIYWAVLHQGLAKEVMQWFSQRGGL